MSAQSDDDSTLPEYSDRGKSAKESATKPGAPSVQSIISEIPTENRDLYANVFKRVQCWDGQMYSHHFMSFQFKKYKALNPKIDFWSVGTLLEDFFGQSAPRRRDTPLLASFISVEKATVQLERFLYSSERIPRTSTGALKRLQKMIERGDNGTWGPELVAKSFYDWDTLFFNSRLLGHCVFEWTSGADCDLGAVRNHNMGYRWARVKVELNATRIP